MIKFLFGEIVKLKSIFENCEKYSYDSKFSLSLTDKNVKKLNLKNQTIKKDEFESLSSCVSLTLLDVSGTKIQKNDSAELLSTEEINEMFNRIISNFTNLEQLSLNGFSNLTDGRFLKKLTKLQRLDVRGCGIATNTKNLSGEDIGLENLNNITSLKQLAVNNANIDLSKIQPTINNVFKGGAATGASDIFPSWSEGLCCDNPTVLNTLSKCTEITKLRIHPEGFNFELKDLTLDLSGCSKLNEIYFSFFKLKKCIVPNSLLKLWVRSCNSAVFEFKEGSLVNDIYIEGSGAANIYGTIANCTKLKKFELRDDVIPSNISYMGNLQQLNSLIIGGKSYSIKNVTGLENLKAFSNLNSLTSFTMDYVTNNNLDFLSNLPKLTSLSIFETSISDISGISRLTNLTTINMYNNKISDISVLENMTNCTSLNLSGNKISNVLPLRNMNKLTTLNLENNAIYDFANGQSNLEVLANLHTSRGGKLTKLLLNGNNITDFSKVSSLTWPNGKSGF